MATNSPATGNVSTTPLPAGTRLASLHLYQHPTDDKDQNEYRLARVGQTGQLILVSLSGVVKHVGQYWARQQIMRQIPKGKQFAFVFSPNTHGRTALAVWQAIKVNEGIGEVKKHV